MTETCSITPGTETQLPASGGRAAPPCSSSDGGSDLLLAAMKLVGKLRLIHGLGEYRAVWECAQIHRGPYKGPKYDMELQALEKEIEAEGLRIFPKNSVVQRLPKNSTA